MMKIKDQLIAIMDGECNIDAEVDQTKYPRPDWAVDQIVRASGLVEDICCHSIGHPNETWLKIHDPDGELCMGLHGCDGCCTPGMRDEVKRAYEKKWGESP